MYNIYHNKDSKKLCDIPDSTLLRHNFSILVYNILLKLLVTEKICREYIYDTKNIHRCKFKILDVDYNKLKITCRSSDLLNNKITIQLFVQKDF